MSVKHVTTQNLPANIPSATAADFIWSSDPKLSGLHSKTHRSLFLENLQQEPETGLGLSGLLSRLCG